ncbi:MAG: S8 family serine peptidase [Planctomycetes bacterium]|nr:S8 family serine peptidase [Planctomycetota bacterium]
MKRRWIIAVLAAFLLVAMVGLAEAAEGRPPVPIDKVKVIITFNRPPGAAEQALVRGHGGSIKYTYHIVPAIAATIPHAAIKGLRRNPRIARVEMDVVVRLTDAELDSSWGVKRIGAGLVHDADPPNKGTGVKVAVIDTGIDGRHPDLDANYRGGYNYVNPRKEPKDDDGHGTHVAGIIAAEDNNDPNSVVGVAPEAWLYALKVIRRDGTGDVSDIIAAVQWSKDNDMDVINMSLGFGHVQAMQDACKEAYDAGVVVVASAGNSGNEAGTGDNVLCPARYESVIGVAATKQDDSRASFSSTGPDVELAAPGYYVFSTIPGGGYGWASGTSMACPHVVGTAALVRAANPTWTSAEVRTQLASTADDLGDPDRDWHFGFGLVDAAEAAGIEVPERHDVAVTSITAPSMVVEGHTATIVVLVTNEGTFDEGTEHDPIVITLTDTTVDPDTPMYSQDIWPLAFGDSTTVTFNWDTTGSSLGDHVLEAYASLDGDEDLADNSKTATINVAQEIHDVAVISVGPPVVPKEQTVDMSVVVANQGTATETFYVTLTDVTDTEDPIPIPIGSPESLPVTLQPSDSATLIFQWYTGSMSGDHLLEAVAIAVAGETDTDDNTKTTTVNVTGEKVLHVEVVTNCSGCPTGSYVMIPVTIRENDATGPPVARADVRVEILTPHDITYAGASKTDKQGNVVFGYSPHPTDPAGVYTVTAYATKRRFVSGSDTTTFKFIDP